MHFDEALNAIRGGAIVRRESWSYESANVKAVTLDRQRKLQLIDESNRPYSPSKADQLASDWVIVEDAPDAET